MEILEYSRHRPNDDRWISDNFMAITIELLN